MTEDLPPGYEIKEGLAFGSRVPGLLEIKFHYPQTKNAITGGT